MILGDLQALAVPIEEIRTMEGNPRKGDVESVMRSLDRFGQRKPVVVRSDTREVIAGNHTFLAAKRLGWPEIAVVWVSDTDAEAKAFALADNRTSELGTYDDDALIAMIQEVRAEDAALLASASYTDDDLASLLASTLDASGPEDDAAEDAGLSLGGHATMKLSDRFMVPPFTVMNARYKWWQDRKQAWADLGIESELGREDKPRTWNLAPAPGGAGTIARSTTVG